MGQLGPAALDADQRAELAGLPLCLSLALVLALLAYGFAEEELRELHAAGEATSEGALGGSP
ncbi:MAG: hypothetical protein ACI8QC_003630 [Planctomycetota bacterium]|jgi:hypothetical protein